VATSATSVCWVIGSQAGVDLPEITSALARMARRPIGSPPFWGLYLSDSSGNRIGTNGDGTSDALEGNLIAFNGGSGLTVAGASTGNSIHGNSIYSNGGLGIDLGGRRRHTQ